MINVGSQLLFTAEKKNAINEFIEASMKEYDYRTKIIKGHFNKNLAMSEEHE